MPRSLSRILDVQAPDRRPFQASQPPLRRTPALPPLCWAERFPGCFLPLLRRALGSGVHPSFIHPLACTFTEHLPVLARR